MPVMALTNRCAFLLQMPKEAPETKAEAPSRPFAGRRSRSGGAAAEEQGNPAEPSEAESSAQPMEEDADGDGGSDGILELQPHYQYISGLRCVSLPDALQMQQPCPCLISCALHSGSDAPAGGLVARARQRGCSPSRMTAHCAAWTLAQGAHSRLCRVPPTCMHRLLAPHLLHL